MEQLDVVDVNTNKARQLEMSEEERRRRARRARARRLAIKKRKRQRRIRLCVCGLVILVFSVIIGKWDTIMESLKGTEADSSNIQSVVAEKAFLYEVEFEDFFVKYKPEALEESQVYKRLKELSEEYPQLERIYESCDNYPIQMLAALCNNPEMYQYMEGYLRYEAGDTTIAKLSELSEEEKKQKYPLFLQWDARWGYEEYGDFNIALSGCGPTTLAMAIAAVANDTDITPDKVAKYSMENGFYVEGTGTAWRLMTDGAETFGLQVKELVLDEEVMKQAIDDGKVIICSVRQGDFTSGGHFIMIYGYDKNGFKINDPNCIYRSSRYWTYEELKSQIRILWAYESA